LWDGVRQKPLCTGFRVEEHGSVFDDYPIEAVEFGKDGDEIFQAAAGIEDEEAAGSAEALHGFQIFWRNESNFGNRFVEVGSDGADVPHLVHDPAAIDIEGLAGKTVAKRGREK